MVETAATRALRTAVVVALDTMALALAGSSFVAASMGMPMRLTMRIAQVGLSSAPTAPSRLLRSTGSMATCVGRASSSDLCMTQSTRTSRG